MSELIGLEHEADIGAVRRRFAALAAIAGLDESRTSDAALIATELATNVLRHAGHGGALLGAAPAPGAPRPGVAIAVWDRGPGMDVAACLRDGMSTAGTAGVGLGAVSRLASRWDAYAPRGKGTVIAAYIAPAREPPEQPRPRFQTGAVCLPYPGLPVRGDAWDVHATGDVATLVVCDGLGHGEGAAEASRAVLGAFRERPGDPPAAILDRASRAARPTRGAAATVVRVDLAAREATISAVGNVTAWIAGDDPRQLVTQHGTLGHTMPRLREERYAFPAGATLVVASDGLKSRLELDTQAGLLTHDPMVIAAALWRDHHRGRDDATAVILREAR
ncbi:MAG TPA: ATP-binding protein [Kofleriaceae bacterium]|nr:ATP-binding protein [Kofleriaceae bacterium]